MYRNVSIKQICCFSESVRFHTLKAAALDEGPSDIRSPLPFGCGALSSA
jgi:hypothetical protein